MTTTDDAWAIVEQSLHGKTEDERLEAGGRLIHLPLRTAMRLVQRLAGGRVRERVLACKIAGELGIPHAPRRHERMALLRRLLRHDPSLNVRLEAVRAMGRLGQDIGMDCSRQLRPLATHPDPRVRLCVAQWVPVVGRGIPLLLSLTRDAETVVAEWAVFNLGLYLKGKVEAVSRRLVELAEGPNRILRHEAVRALVNLKHPRALGLLTDALKQCHVDERLTWAVFDLGLEVQGIDWKFR